MKKPSSQIIDIMDNLPSSTTETGFLITVEQRDQVVALCKAVDKRDQQLRKGKKLPVLPVTKRRKPKARR